MEKKQTTYVFIDAQNLNLGIKNDIKSRGGRLIYKGKLIDYRKFRQYLTDKFRADRAMIFMGYVQENEKLYSYLRKAGFEIIFKKTTKIYHTDKVKGNVDIDIAVYSAARLFDKYDKAIFVSGDGDFLELYDYLKEKNKLMKLIIPNQYAYSRLLRRHYREKVVFLNAVSGIFYDKKKAGGSGRSESLGMSGTGPFTEPRDDENSIAKSNSKVKSPKRSKK